MCSGGGGDESIWGDDYVGVRFVVVWLGVGREETCGGGYRSI